MSGPRTRSKSSTSGCTLAEADCPSCEALGHRSCDVCGGPAWDADGEGNQQNLFRDFLGRELCGYCHADASERV